MDVFVYFCNMIAKLPTYEDARKAIRGSKDPKAFLHLGILYAKGIGTARNQVLAYYYLKKALDAGCEEAQQYINQAYEAGFKNFARDIISAIGDPDNLTPETIAKLKKRIEGERLAKNYGHLSRLSGYLHLFYPEYDRDKAIDDILNDRDTLDADLLYATCTSNNDPEIYVGQQESLLRQLYAPVEAEAFTTDDIERVECEETGESELMQCLANIVSSYEKVCKCYGVDMEDINAMTELKFFPYLKVSTLVTLRQMGFRCLLSVRDIDPAISGAFLDNLRDSVELLNISEAIKDQDLQLLLISFVELNIILENFETGYLELFRAYKNNDLQPLADRLNTCVRRLTDAGIKHHLPVYTTDNLPAFNMSD